MQWDGVARMVWHGTINTKFEWHGAINGLAAGAAGSYMMGGGGMG